MAIHRIGPFERDAAVAGADLSDKLFRAVSLDATGKVVITAAGAAPIGFLIETSTTDRPVSFSNHNANISNGLAESAIAIGDELVVGADGKLAKAAAAGDGFGFARNAAAADSFC